MTSRFSWLANGCHRPLGLLVAGLALVCAVSACASSTPTSSPAPASSPAPQSSSSGGSPGAAGSGAGSAVSGNPGGTSPAATGSSGSSVGGSAGAGASSSARPGNSRCPKEAALTGRTQAQPGSALPPGLKVAAVIECLGQQRSYPDGTWLTLVTERASGPATALLAALRQPPVRSLNQICPMFLQFVPYFELIGTSGEEYLPRLPTDQCGKPQGAVIAALNALSFTEIAATKIEKTG